MVKLEDRQVEKVVAEDGQRVVLAVEAVNIDVAPGWSG